MSAQPGIRIVFVRDMVLHASIGVYPHEHQGSQRIRINVQLAVEETEIGTLGTEEPGVGADRLDRVVSYELVVERVRALVEAGHVKLVETLAERIAAACLGDSRVRSARVRVEKLDVFADAGSAGVEVQRCRLSTGAN